MDAFLRRGLAVIADHGGLSIESVQRSGDDLALQVRVLEGDGRDETWVITARDVREHRIELGWTDGLTFSGDHPLLWPHLGEQAQLFFSARPQNSASMVGRLYERHRRETQSWYPFERFLNQEMPVGSLLDAGAGLLASGPLRLLTAYGDELRAEAISFSIAGNQPAKYWKPDSEQFMGDGSWIVEDQPLKVLAIGNSYIVGGRFTARP